MSQIDVIDEITNKPQSPEARVTLTPAELEATAVHEAGHALALFMSRSKGVDIGFVTIVPREDGTLGFVAPLPDERVHLTRADYDEKLQVFVAGRAAEELTWGKEGVSSGSSTDLHQATILAIQMVTQLGLAGGSRLLWTEKPSAADLERADLALTQAYERILAKLKKNRGRLMALAKELVLRQELPGDDVRKILAT